MSGGAGSVYLRLTDDLATTVGLSGPVALADLPRLAAAVDEAAQTFEGAEAGAALLQQSPQQRAAPGVIIPFPVPTD